MYVAGFRSEPAHQRARGALRIDLRHDGATTRLAVLRQDGCLKARFPRPESPGWTTGVLLNTGGGVAGGDALETAVALAPGAHATIVTQAAERYYRALPGSAPSRVRGALSVAAGAALEWLPQEAILFDRCALDRRLDITLADDAWFLGVESLVFGRAAMGETVQRAAVSDTIRLSRGGRLVLHDAIRLHGPVAGMLDRAAVAGGGRAVATLLFSAPGAAGALDALRAALDGAQAAGGVACGASCRDGTLMARIVAADGACQRRAVVAGLAALRGGRSLPRVWSC